MTETRKKIAFWVRNEGMTEADWRSQPGPWAHLTKEQTDELIAAEVKQARADALEEAARIAESLRIPLNPGSQYMPTGIRDMTKDAIAAAIRERAKNDSPKD